MASPTIGQQVRSLRKMRAMTQRALAREAGVTPSAISQIESGTFTPTLDTLSALASALDAELAVTVSSEEAGVASDRIAQLWDDLDESERGAIDALLTAFEARRRRD